MHVTGTVESSAIERCGTFGRPGKSRGAIHLQPAPAATMEIRKNLLPENVPAGASLYWKTIIVLHRAFYDDGEGTSPLPGSQYLLNTHNDVGRPGLQSRELADGILFQPLLFPEYVLHLNRRKLGNGFYAFRRNCHPQAGSFNTVAEPAIAERHTTQKQKEERWRLGRIPESAQRSGQVRSTNTFRDIRSDGSMYGIMKAPKHHETMLKTISPTCI